VVDITVMFITSAKTIIFLSLFVWLSICLLATLCNNFQMDLHEIFREGWQCTDKQIINFYWQSGSFSGYRDCFLNSSLLGDMESGINRLCCAMLQCTTCTSRHRRSYYDVITSSGHNRQLRHYWEIQKVVSGHRTICWMAGLILLHW